MRVGFYRPVESEAELDRLASRLERRVGRARLVVFAWALVAVAMAVINLLTLGQSESAGEVRWWSLVAIAGVGVGVVPLIVSRFWILPRALRAQRWLLEQRRVWSRVLPIRRAEAALAAGLEEVKPRRLDLEGMLAAARGAAADRIDALLEGPPSDPGSVERELARLDTYLAVLRALRIDQALDPGLLATSAADRALERALALFRPPSAGEAADAASAAAGRHSIVVLPFVDLSAEDDPHRFGEGLAEELISALTPIPELRVIARGSAFAFQGRDPDLQQIVRRLEVDTVIEGSVRRAGSRIRVTVQMVRAADGLHLWSARYDRQLDDIFAVQDEIAAAVVERLRREVLEVDATPRASRKTAEIGAYSLYLEARHHCARRTPNDLEAALERLQRALDLDAGYALAQAGIAEVQVLRGYYGMVGPSEAFPAAQRAARAALDLDGELAEAHAALAFARLLYDRQWDQAAEGFRRSLELNAGYATARHWYAEHLAFQARHEEALEQARIALALDPLSRIINVLVGWVLYYAGRYEEAVPVLEATLRLGPEFAPAEFWLGLSYERLGDPRRAERSLERAVERSERNPMMLASLGRFYALQGRGEEAQAVGAELDRVAARRYVPPYWMAAFFSGHGESEAVWEWLERADRERDSWMVFLGIDPVWEPLRKRPRFRALLRSVGLEAEGS